MGEMHGARRVITFCLLTAVLPTVLLIIPLYLRHSVYADVSYAVAESDVLEVLDGISPLFCQEQILRMNTTFRAFQLAQMPPLSHHKKHIKLRKRMIIPDDTVEYWGFYLLEGSIVTLLACSRYEGAGVLVVKGEKNLKTCSILDPPNKIVRFQKSPNLPLKQNSSKDNIKSILHDFPKSQLSVADHLSKRNISNQLSSNILERNRDEVPDILELTKEVKEYISNYTNSNSSSRNHTEKSLVYNSSESKSHNYAEVDFVNNMTRENNSSNENFTSGHSKVKRAVKVLTQELLEFQDEGLDSGEQLTRMKRKNVIVPGHILDAGIGHGGNANVTEQPELESSDSSFEDSLHKCYEGQELFSKEIDPNFHCYNNISLEHLKIETVHITSDGYYYFIFYSDNDHHKNPINAEFDIFKTTYEHTNYTRGCINETECRFPISFTGKEIVIVEVPTRDGIEQEDGDTSVLISSCYPRMSVYAIFPITVLFLILGCAFL